MGNIKWVSLTHVSSTDSNRKLKYKIFRMTFYHANPIKKAFNNWIKIKSKIG